MFSFSTSLTEKISWNKLVKTTYDEIVKLFTYFDKVSRNFPLIAAARIAAI